MPSAFEHDPGYGLWMTARSPERGFAEVKRTRRSRYGTRG